MVFPVAGRNVNPVRNFKEAVFYREKKFSPDVCQINPG